MSNEQLNNLRNKLNNQGISTTQYMDIAELHDLYVDMLMDGYRNPVIYEDDEDTKLGCEVDEQTSK